MCLFRPPLGNLVQVKASGPQTKCLPTRILCHAIALSGQKSGFRVGFRPNSRRGSLQIGRRPAGEPILRISRLMSGRDPARKPDLRPGSTSAYHRKQVAILFSGSWCPWCRVFTPFLEATYNKVKLVDARDTEVVYIPVDDDLEACALRFVLRRSINSFRFLG